MKLHFYQPLKSGFTLLEFVLYIGLTAAILISLLSFTWNILQNYAKTTTLIEVNNNGNFALEQMVYYTRRASTIGSGTVYTTHPGKLTLTFPTDPTVTIDTYQKNITVGDTPLTITKLRLQHGSTTPTDITSDKIQVTNFTLTNLTNNSLPTIRFSLNLQAVNPSNSTFYEAEKTFITSATLRAQ